MSLINEALKKAQRQRLEGSAAAGATGADAGGAIAKRPQPKSAKSTLLIVAGAAVLVVASMVGTALYVSGPSKPGAPVPKSAVASAPAASSELPAISPVITLPTTSAPATTASPASKDAEKNAAGASSTSVAGSAVLAPAGAKVADAKAGPPKANTTPENATTTSEPLEPTAPAKPDERIQQFVDALRVTGIRSSGNDSKVLMNDRVYRVNDIVDRNLGVRLTKVAADNLTFTDANGATYVKYF